MEQKISNKENGQDSVDYVRDHDIDIVIMDIRLVGDMDGVEAAHRIREFSSVPIIFMSAYADRRNDPAINEIQPLAFLTKPVSFDNLRELLRSA